MQRRRLTIVLATALASGLIVLPAAAGSLDPVLETTNDVVTTVEDTVDTAEDTLLPEDTVDSDVDVEVAPSDEDGSVEFEVEDGITVGDEEVDVGELTDPVEELVDPDPAPSGGDGPEDPSDDDSPGGNSETADDDISTADTPEHDGTTNTETRQLPRGISGGASGFGSGAGGDFDAPAVVTPDVTDEVQEPLVAERPAVGDNEQAVLATDPTPDDGSPAGVLLKLFASILLAGTLVLWGQRALDRA